MNIELRRYGIVIKSMRVTGEKASIGSGADREIQIEDPYLSDHVGDLVRRGESWFIVDAGTSLDGITRDGERVDDEVVIDGRVYSIGGFELVPHLDSSEKPASSGPRAGAMIPGTVIEELPDFRRTIPGTMMEPMPDLGPSRAEIPGTVVEPLPQFAKKEIPATVFEMQIPKAPAAVPAPPVAPAPTPRSSSPRRILLLATLTFGFLLLLLLLIVKGGKKKDVAKTETTATQTTAPVVATVAPAPPPVAVAGPAELLGGLKYDAALAAWEKQLASGDDPTVRARYAELALEVGRIHAANHSPDARAYYGRAVKFGPAGSDAVAEAKKRLGS
jgi:hypothetical protein